MSLLSLRSTDGKKIGVAHCFGRTDRAFQNPQLDLTMPPMLKGSVTPHGVILGTPA